MASDECFPFSQLPRYSQNFTYERSEKKKRGRNLKERFPIAKNWKTLAMNFPIKPQCFNIERKEEFFLPSACVCVVVVAMKCKRKTKPFSSNWESRSTWWNRKLTNTMTQLSIPSVEFVFGVVVLIKKHCACVGETAVWGEIFPPRFSFFTLKTVLNDWIHRPWQKPKNIFYHRMSSCWGWEGWKWCYGKSQKLEWMGVEGSEGWRSRGEASDGARRSNSFDKLSMTFTSPPQAQNYFCRQTNTSTHKSVPLPVVASWLRHHLWFLILSSVNRFSGLGTRIFLMRLSVNVSSLLHGVITVYLLSFQARYSLHPYDGWSHGSSSIKRNQERS